MTGQKPDYDVKIGARAAQGEKGFSRKVGAAWINKAGGINIRLDPGVSIATPEGVDLCLWKPWEDRQDGDGQQQFSDAPGAGTGFAPPASDEEDDIPF